MKVLLPDDEESRLGICAWLMNEAANSSSSLLRISWTGESILKKTLEYR